MKRTPLTKDEQTYIEQMFEHKCRYIADLPVGEIALFLENREMESKKKWPLDHSIAEKFLRFHGLPLKTTLKEYERRHLKRLERIQDKQNEEDTDWCIKNGLLVES